MSNKKTESQLFDEWLDSYHRFHVSELDETNAWEVWQGAREPLLEEIEKLKGTIETLQLDLDGWEQTQ